MHKATKICPYFFSNRITLSLRYGDETRKVDVGRGSDFIDLCAIACGDDKDALGKQLRQGTFVPTQGLEMYLPELVPGVTVPDPTPLSQVNATKSTSNTVVFKVDLMREEFGSFIEASVWPERKDLYIEFKVKDAPPQQHELLQRNSFDFELN